MARLKVQLERYEQLLPSNAISKQVSNAQAQYRQALADVAQMKALLARQNLNLQYATVRAPISGRIGQSLSLKVHWSVRAIPIRWQLFNRLIKSMLMLSNQLVSMSAYKLRYKAVNYQQIVTKPFVLPIATGNLITSQQNVV